jgi:YbbR domain-containing protein
VKSVQINYDISGVSETQNSSLTVEVLDENGDTINGISISPDETTINLPISLLGGFKNVVVKVDTTGQIADGYRLTNLAVSPPTITVFSEDPRILDRLPGFVDTLPVDLSNLSDDSESSVGLRLPEGVTAVRNPDVLVQISIASIESSETFSVPVLITGLSPDFDAYIAPELVDVIVAGPINILESLETADVRVLLDLEGLPAGSLYQLTPEVDIIPDQLRAQTTLPETIEVEILLAPTPTPNGTQVITATPSPAP